MHLTRRSNVDLILHCLSLVAWVIDESLVCDTDMMNDVNACGYAYVDECVELAADVVSQVDVDACACFDSGV